MDFTHQLKESNIPTTEAELTAEFENMAKQHNFYPLNTSGYSPFWRLIQTLFVKPTHSLIMLLAKKIIPNGFLKTATGEALDLLAWPYAIVRKQATYATGVLVFTKKDILQGVDIPKDTIIRTPYVNGKIYRVKTTQTITIEPDTLSKNIPVIALSEGVEGNLGAGYYCIIESPIDGVLSVKNQANWIISPGADKESDEALRLRIRNIFLATAQWHTNAKYTAMISEFAGIDTDRIYFDNSAPRGPGTADIYILFDVADDSVTFLNNVQNYIMHQGNHGHGDDVQVKALPPLNVSLPITIRFKPNLSTVEKTKAKTVLTDFIRCAFRENNAFNPNTITKTYPFKIFSVSQLFSEVHALLPEIVSMRTTTNDFAPQMQIPRLTTLTITEV